MGDLRTISKGAVYTFFGLLLSKVMGYFWRTIVARLGSEDYGLLSISLVVLGIANMLSFLGLESGIVRYLAYYEGKNDPSRMKGVITSSIKLAVPLSFIVAFVIFIYSDFIADAIFKNQNLSPLLKIISFAVLPYLVYNLSIAALNGLKKIEYVVISRQIMEGALRLVATLALLFFGYGILGVGAAYVITYVFVAGLSLYFLRKAFPLFKKIKAISVRRELLTYSFPILISGIVAQVFAWTDLLMLGYFRSASEVGIYNTALPTAGLMIIVPAALCSLFLPVITANYAKRLIKNIEQLYIKITKLIIASNIPIVFVTIFFSKDILAFVFGKEYAQGGSALIFLALGYFVYAFATTSNLVLNMLKKTKLLMTLGILSTLFNAVLNYLLIPVYGMSGAAVASALSLMLGSSFSVYFTYKYMGITPFDKSIIYLSMFGALSIGVMYLGLHAIYSTVPILSAILGVSSFLLMYTYLIFKFRIVTLHEARQILGFLNAKKSHYIGAAENRF